MCLASPRQTLAESGATCQVCRIQGASSEFAFGFKDSRYALDGPLREPLLSHTSALSRVLDPWVLTSHGQ
ncbi:hypothetical protein GCM10009767_07820 [Kocuria aegyptia]|uniref:Uncharacterized protein n=1 Tax=Kocuria aegyptia TaxID=330943 RepID=A0ABN2K9H7_9MICC